MIVEYGHFGDVVCLDTSCARNANSRPFVQFVGLNNHRQAVTFGAAFLYDDSVNSFKWLVRTFVEAMSGKKPKFVLSDQDATVVQAIHAVLPETSHCICAWQMYLIALKHLRHVVNEYDSFTGDFRNCIFGHEQEEDFIQAWDFMLEKHGLRHNAWLRWMFREKEKWAVAYGRNAFFIERNGTHLVELMSDRLRSYLGPDIDMLQFFKHFESVVNEQRYRELESTLDMGRQAPVLMANANIKVVPSYYILRRWTKDARILPVGESHSYPEDDNRKIVATRYKDLCRNIIKISARAAESDTAFEFAARQLDEVMQGVERILHFNSFEEAKGTCASDNELADADLDRNDFEGQGVDVLKGTTETENMVPNKDQLNHCDDQIPGVSGGLAVRPSPPETVLSVACGPSTYISSPSPTPSLEFTYSRLDW
ncbi:protein FAR1-RELATED SEQUENCE 7 [Sesamum angolense]|uniref:Protein FAR1-RELATED SEQUENCE n=1 Tax=Sesamum angolense TaxID=2727404 RepID=A0AAE1WDM0_9LAMI|nr:protein FAR1-RELATED SEQUENCE 7 [Sesamum angolense]